MKFIAFSFSVALGALPAAVSSQEASIGEVKLRVNCTTDATKGDGKRHSCADKEEYTAPPGFVLDQQSINVRMGSANGSEKICDFEFSDFRPVIPGLPISQPGKVVIIGQARSPRGHWSGRGWISCDASVMQVDIPSSDEAQTQGFVQALSTQGIELDIEGDSSVSTFQADSINAPEDLVNDNSADIEFEPFNTMP